jgi:hypothetical protein
MIGEEEEHARALGRCSFGCSWRRDSFYGLAQRPADRRGAAAAAMSQLGQPLRVRARAGREALSAQRGTAWTSR